MALTEEEKREVLEVVRSASTVIEEQPSADSLGDVGELLGTKEGEMVNVPVEMFIPRKVESEKVMAALVASGTAKEGQMYYTEEEG